MNRRKEEIEIIEAEIEDEEFDDSADIWTARIGGFVVGFLTGMVVMGILIYFMTDDFARLL